MSEPRGHWRSNTGFILAATGSAIGLGNLWKFPFITWENNGGAFVLVYLVCITAVGLPIMMAELLIGRATQKSVVGALKEAMGPAWGCVGLWGVFCGFLLLSYYTVIAGWSLFYFAKSTGWMVGGFPEGASMGDLFGEQSANGGLQLGLSLGFSIATVSIVYFGVQKGIERIARVFLPILFGILVLLLVSALRMDGAGEAIGFIFRPSFGELDGGSVLEALGHSFFTLSLGMGAMVTYGSIHAAPHRRIEFHSIHPSCVPQNTLGMLGGPRERSGFPPPSGRFTPPLCGLVLLRRSHLTLAAHDCGGYKGYFRGLYRMVPRSTQSSSYDDDDDAARQRAMKRGVYFSDTRRGRLLAQCAEENSKCLAETLREFDAVGRVAGEDVSLSDLKK